MFEIQRYNTIDQSAWDTFVPRGNNGTLFHLRAFLNYHPENRFKDHSLLIKKKGKLFSVFPAAEKKIDDTINSLIYRKNLTYYEKIELHKNLALDYYKLDKIDQLFIY